MERVSRPWRRAAIKVKPSLASSGRGAHVPGEAQRLQTATRQVDEVLLKRGHAERVLDFEIRRSTVWAVGLDVELALSSKERRSHACVSHVYRVEATSYRPIRGFGHGRRVLRASPGSDLAGVAFRAGIAADVLRRGLICATYARLLTRVPMHPGRGDDRGDNDGNNESSDETRGHRDSAPCHHNKRFMIRPHVSPRARRPRALPVPNIVHFVILVTRPSVRFMLIS
jgi:hypothetical protein